MHALKLIALYDYVYKCYTTTLQWQVQRFSANGHQGQITDAELLTIYLFCTAFEEKTKLKSMHKHIQKYWLSWFPTLPAYQTFNSRINRIRDVFPTLISQILTDIGLDDDLILTGPPVRPDWRFNAYHHLFA